jgi:hypothetical protein
MFSARKDMIVGMGFRIDKYRILKYVMTVLILFTVSTLIYFLHFINQDTSIKLVGTITTLIIVVTWLFFEFKVSDVKQEIYVSPIRRIVLITRDGEREKEWHVEGMKSMLIGKGTINSEVDIELGDTHYAEYISNEHSVLNYTGGFWYIEDLESTNGLGIKKKGEEYTLKVKPLTPYKIDEGDIIYISKAKLLVR